MDQDIKYLKETLTLAKKSLSWTYPNPMVGALIVKGVHIIGEGFHHRAGLPHGEIEALKNCQQSAKGSTLYVNLEPCSHFGKTPPCTDAIIKSGIKRVVFCTLDPNPKERGKGKKLLQKASVETSWGILEKEARILNETFFTFHEKRRPFVAIKFAASLDGKLATHNGDSKWITNEKARIYARDLRSQYQALLVGINTIISDNPHLGVRVKGKKDPIRIIIDPNLKIPMDSLVLRDNNVIIFTSNKGDQLKKESLKEKGIDVYDLGPAPFSVKKILSLLYQKNIISLLVEGGGQTLGSFVDKGLVDKVYSFHTPILIGGNKSVSIGGKGVESVKKAIHLINISYKKFGDNILTIGYVS